MCIRDQLANGTFEKTETTQNINIAEFEVPEGNFFMLKDKTRGYRMEKSWRAREQRHMLRSIKQNRHRLGYSA